MPQIHLFHRTTLDAARAILAEGFVDGNANDCGFDSPVSGVWLSDVPVDSQDGAKNGPLLLVSVDEAGNERLAKYEVIEEGNTYRAWFVPAQLLNAISTVRF